MVWVRFVITEYLCAHVQRREIIPYRYLAAILRVPKYVPAFGRSREHARIVEQRVWSPREGHAENFTFRLHQRHRGQLRGQLAIIRNAGQIQRWANPVVAIMVATSLEGEITSYVLALPPRNF